MFDESVRSPVVLQGWTTKMSYQKGEKTFLAWLLCYQKGENTFLAWLLCYQSNQRSGLQIASWLFMYFLSNA